MPFAPSPTAEEPLRARTAGFRWRFGRVWLAFALAACGAAALLLVDRPVARWARFSDHPHLLRDLLDKAEPFGHGLGVTLIVAAIFLLDPARRWGLPRVIACTAAAGFTADGIKLLISRARPHSFKLAQPIWHSFGDWFPLGAGGGDWQSFPSGHTATAFGFAVALAWLYPRGRWFFYLLAVMVACQRVEIAAHFVSDVLCGAALGFFFGAMFFDWGLLPGWCERFESCLRRCLNRNACDEEAGEESVESLPQAA